MATDTCGSVANEIKHLGPKLGNISNRRGGGIFVGYK